MEFDPALFYLIPAIFVAGFIDSIAGGGGLIAVPALLLSGIPPILTLGTNKFISTIGTVVSASKYIVSKRIIWPVAWVGIPFSMIGSTLGAYTVTKLDQAIVQKAILIILPLAAVMTLLPKPKEHREHKITWQSLRLWIVVPIIGFSIGWYDGFFGPGTGSFLIILFYGVLGLSLLHSAAVGRLFNLISNASALITFMIGGKILYTLAIPLALSSMAGHYCGSHLALKKGDNLIRWMLLVACTLLFLFLAWKQFATQ